MPKIGMRMIKTAIAVFLCFLVGMVRTDGVVFYSAIAAVLCMQSEIEDSKEKAKSRIIATIIGGIAGLVFLNIEKYLIPMPIEILRYFIISVVIILLIYFTVVIKQPAAAYLSCVVFMSVTISHVNDINVSTFALNRILDTLIGIVISLGVNQIHLPFLKRKEDIIVFNFDQLYPLYKSNSFKFKKYFQEDPNIVLTSSKTPAILSKDLQDIKMKLPVIIMDGAAIFDNQQKKYLYVETFDNELLQQIRTTIDSKTSNYFCYEVNNDHLIIHLSKLTNIAAIDMYDSTKHLQYKHYFHHQSSNYQTEQPVSEILIIDEVMIIEQIKAALTDQAVSIKEYQEEEYPNIGFLKLYPKDTSIEKQIQHIQKERKLENKQVYIVDENSKTFKEIDTFIKKKGK